VKHKRFLCINLPALNCAGTDPPARFNHRTDRPRNPYTPPPPNLLPLSTLIPTPTPARFPGTKLANLAEK